MQTCPHCGKVFEPRKRWQRFCSNRCKTAAWYALNADAHKARLRARRAAKRAEIIEPVHDAFDADDDANAVSPCTAPRQARAVPPSPPRLRG